MLAPTIWLRSALKQSKGSTSRSATEQYEGFESTQASRYQMYKRNYKHLALNERNPSFFFAQTVPGKDSLVVKTVRLWAEHYSNC